MVARTPAAAPDATEEQSRMPTHMPPQTSTPPYSRFGFNQSPDDFISRDTPLPLRLETDATAGTAPVSASSKHVEVDIPQKLTSIAIATRVSNAAPSSTTGAIQPPFPVADAALSAASLEASAEKPQARVTLRENAERAESLTRALATAIKREIDRLKDERLNDPKRQAEIGFLEVISATLDQIAAAIGEARRASTSQDRDQKFTEAEALAGGLAKDCRDFAERNYERITDYGGYSVFVTLGTLFFVNYFGVSPEFAMGAQLALLGLSRPKK